MPLVMLVINAESVRQVREPVLSREHSNGLQHPLIPDILLTLPIICCTRPQSAHKRRSNGMRTASSSQTNPSTILSCSQSSARCAGSCQTSQVLYRIPSPPCWGMVNHHAGGWLLTTSRRSTDARATSESNRFSSKRCTNPMPRALSHPCHSIPKRVENGWYHRLDDCR